MRAIALKKLCNEDALTQISQGYDDVPEGSTVEFIGKITNFYGEFAIVNYNGINYYVKPNSIQICH